MNKITFKSIAVEVLSVVFAVLLALGLNNWWKERSNQNLGKQALQDIVTELNRNMVDLDSTIIELEQRLDSLNKERSDYLNGIDSSLNLGYSQTVLSNTAWETANITQAVLYIDSELIMEIASLYNVQQLYSDFNKDYLKVYSSLEFNKPENNFLSLESNIKQVQLSLSIAKQLSEGYREFFDEFKDRLPERAAR